MTGTAHMYVHVPFCGRRCSYCDFAIAVRRAVPVREYVDAIAAELVTRSRERPPLRLQTLYLGGGTPSRLGADGVVRLIDRLLADGIAVLESGAEVTIEVNPEDLLTTSLRSWRTAGVNRLSIGSQSFHPPTLAWMHRSHDAGAIRRGVEAARNAGIDDISLDLIFAVPHALGRDWAADLDAALALEPDHLSLYGLTVEEHTPLGKWAVRGDVDQAPEEDYASQFLLAHDRLVGAGLEHYEVSNYARPDHRSVHNSAYWRRVPYLGLGPSAHSFDGVERRWNEREYEAWRQRATRGEDPLVGSEFLDEPKELAELAYLGLRTDSGIAVGDAEPAEVRRLVESGWAVVRGNRLTLTPEGWLRLDAIAVALTEPRSR